MILPSQRTPKKGKLACTYRSLILSRSPSHLRLGSYSWSSWLARGVEQRKFSRPIEQTPVERRMLKSKCNANCHNRQVPRRRVRIYVCDAMYVNGEAMQLKVHSKSSVSTDFVAIPGDRLGGQQNDMRIWRLAHPSSESDVQQFRSCRGLSRSHGPAHRSSHARSRDGCGRYHHQT